MSGVCTWVIADDLTGAADSGVLFARDGADVVLDLRAGEIAADARSIRVIDTDTRDADAARTHGVLRRVVSSVGAQDIVLKKVDSLLRGRVDIELSIVKEALDDRLLIVAPAVPAVQRTTVNGLVHRGASPAAQVSARLGNLSSRTLSLDVIRGPNSAAAGALHRAYTAGIDAVICDARTDDDLDNVVRAGATAGMPVVWVGAAGLAAALARSQLTSPHRPTEITSSPLLRSNATLVIVGSSSSTSRAQTRALVDAGARRIGFDIAALVSLTDDQLLRTAEWVADQARGVTTLITIDGAVDPDRNSEAATALGRVCRTALGDAEVVVLAGGATARGVLLEAGVTSLQLLGQLEPGVVTARAGGISRQLNVITKSGTFGDHSTLARLVSIISDPKGSK